MGIFNFGKKKEESCNCETAEINNQASCECGCSCGKVRENDKPDGKEATYVVLGACCKKSEETFENTKTALKEMGIAEEVINIGDAVEIAKYGVMQTPALVIDNKVVSYGKMLKVEEIKRLVEKALTK